MTQRSEKSTAVFFAVLMLLSTVTGSIAYTGVARANGSADQDISVEVTDQQVGTGEATTYTIRIQNNGREETTYTVEPTLSPNDWSVDDQQFDGNNYKQITLGSYESGTVEFEVTAGSTSKSGLVEFGVWHASSGFISGNPKDHKVDSVSGGHTVDANGPRFSNIDTSIDGTEVTVTAEITDLVGVDAVDLNYDTGGWFGGGNTVSMTHQSGDTYTGTFDVGWDQSFSYEVEATDELRNTETSGTESGQTPANTPPTLNIETININGDRTVTIDATANDNTDRLESVRVEWGGFLSNSAEMSHQGGDQYTVTIPDSGSFNWGENVEFNVIAEDNYGKSTSTTESVQMPTNDPPQVGDLEVVTNDDRTITVELTATDNTNEIDRAELTWDRGAFDVGGTTVEMASVGSDRYRATIPESDQLDWGESIQIKATAFDDTGKSTTTETQTVSAVDDTTPPQISNVQVRYDGKDVIVEGELTDTTSGVDTATVAYETEGLFGSGEVTMEQVSGDTYRGVFSVDYGTEFTADIAATDGAENSQTTDEITGIVPRGAAVVEVINNDDESKTVTYLIDGEERGTLTVSPDTTASETVPVDPEQQTVKIEYTDADRDDQTFTEQTAITVPQDGSETAQLMIQERLSPILDVECTECSLGTFNRSNPPEVTIDVNNAGGGDLEWTHSSTPFNVTAKTEDTLVLRPDLETGEFSREVEILVLNEQTDGPTRETVTINGTATVEPEPPSVSLASYPSRLRLGDEPSARAYGESGAAGTPDQPEPAAAENLTYRWMLNGTEVTRTDGMPADGPGAAAETALSFDEPGTYTLQVEAVDPNTGLSDKTESVTIDVGEVSGQITGYESPTVDTYTQDRWYNVSLTVANTGDIRHTFEVSADRRTGLELKEETKSITLAPGETGRVSFEQRWIGNYINTLAFDHNLRIDTESNRSPSVVDEASLELSEPANGEATFRPTTANGEPADVDVTVRDASSSNVVTRTSVANRSLDVTSKTHTFETGTYEVTFEADGYQTRTSTMTITEDKTLQVEPILTPNGVNASLDADTFTVEAGNYSVGDTVNGSVVVENTGDQSYEFFVGYSVRSNKTGVVRSGLGQTGQFVTLDPGERTRVELSWRVDETAAAGEYAAIAAVWYGYPETGATQIESTGWVPESFIVSSDAQTESITYQNRTYIIETNPDNTITVYNKARELVDSETARTVLQYQAFLSYSTDNPSDGWISLTNQSRNLEKYYWLANLNEAGITGFQAYVRAHFGSYEDATGEFIDLGLQGTRIINEQQNTNYSASVHAYAERAKTSHELYTGAKDVKEYTDIVSDAYRIKQSQEGLSMISAIQEAETADDGSVDPDVKGLARGAALDILFAPMNDASAGLRISQQQALLMSTYGKMGRAELEMLRDLEQKRQAGTITPREMEVYFVLQAEFFKSSVQAFHQISELDEQGRNQSYTYSLATSLNGDQLSTSYRESAESFVTLINLKYEQLGRYDARVENVTANTVNIHGEAANTSNLAAPEQLLVTAPVWAEPGEEFTIGVESRGKPVVDARVSVGEQAATTDRNGEASFTFRERGSYNISVTKDEFTEGNSVIQIREPKTIPRTFDDITIGEVDTGQELTRQTTLENTGETTLELAEVTATSDAIEVTAPTGSVSPGDAVTVTTTINTTELTSGVFSEPVTVTWADSDKTSEFTVSGDIVETTGTLSLESAPSDAQVIVDGTAHGTTPLTLNLATGEHSVVVEREGYDAKNRTVSVRANETTSETISLPGQPEIDISTSDKTVTNGSGTATFTISNDGTGPASAVSVDLTQVPSNWKVSGVGPDGSQWDGSQWKLGTLTPGEQTQVSVTVTPPVWAAAGEYTVGAAVEGDETTSQLTHKGGSPPILDPTTNNSQITAGEAVRLSAATSTDLASQTEYEWTLLSGNDSAVSSLPAGPQGAVKMTSPGEYRFRVMATNGSWTNTGNVTVVANPSDAAQNEPPNAAFTVSQQRTETTTTVTYDATQSSDPDGDTLTYRWDLDADGQFDDAVGVTATETFSTGGVQQVAVKVADSFANDTETADINVSTPTEPSPTAVVSPNETTVISGDSVRLNASESSVPNATIEQTTWGVVAGPGTVVDGVYNAPPEIQKQTTATVELTVTDARGRTASDTANVTIRPLSPPVLNITSPETGSLVNNSTVSLELSLTQLQDVTPAGVELRFNNRTWRQPADLEPVTGAQTTSVDIPTAGDTMIDARLINASGEPVEFATAEDSVPVTVDTTPPKTTLAIERSQPTYNAVGPENPAIVRITADDPRHKRTTLEIRNETGDVVTATNLSGATGSGSTAEFAWNGTGSNGVPLASGTYEVIATSVDTANNTKQQSDTIDIDTDTPTLTAINLETTGETDQDGQLLVNGSDNVSISAEAVDGTAGSEPVQTVTVSLEGVDSPYQLTRKLERKNETTNRWETTVVANKLPDDGEYTATVTARDTADNSNRTTVKPTVSVDTTAPELAAVADVATGSDTGTLTLHSSEPLANQPVVNITRPDGSTHKIAVEQQDEQWSGTFEIIKEGTYSVTATGQDQTGNTGRDQATIHVDQLRTENQTGMVLNKETGTYIRFNTTSEVASSPVTVTESNAAPAALTVDRVGMDFLTSELGSELEESLSAATIHIPVNDTQLPEGVNPAEATLTYYNESRGKWEDISTTVEYMNDPTDSTGERAYWVATVTHFSTYGVTTSDTEPPQLESASPATGTVVDPAQSTVDVAFEYGDELTAVNASSVGLTVNGNPVDPQQLEISPNRTAYEFDVQPAEHTGETQTVQLTVSDKAGNTATFTRSFTIAESDAVRITDASPSDETLSAGTSTVPVSFDYELSERSVDTDRSALTVTTVGGDPVSVEDVQWRSSTVVADVPVQNGTTYTTHLTLVDKRGTTKTTQETFSVASRTTSSDTNGSSGGGSGGGAGGAGASNEESIDSSVTHLSDQVTAKFSGVSGSPFLSVDLKDTITGNQVAIQEFGINMRLPSDGFRIEADRPTSTPPSTQALDDADPVAYIESRSYNLESPRVNNIRLQFTVEETAIPDEAQADDVSLYYYADGSWTAVETDHQGDGEFSAVTPEFTVFAIGINQSDTDDSSDSEDPSETNSSETNSSETGSSDGSPTPDSDTSSSDDSIPGFEPLTMILALLVLLASLRIRVQ